MGLIHTLTRTIAKSPIAIHFDSEVIRLMQFDGGKQPTLNNAVEVPRNDECGLKEAISSLKGNNCILCVPSHDVLVQHIKVSNGTDFDAIREKLIQQDSKWAQSEIRHLCVSTSGSGSTGSVKQELLCMGIDKAVSQHHVELVESAGGIVRSVTIPLYASICAFDKLYRREGDEKITSMLIDFDTHASMIMIAHGRNCVFAHRLGSPPVMKEKEWEAPNSMKQVSVSSKDEFERREQQEPRGLHAIEKNIEPMDQQLKRELSRCLQHHDALFPQRAIDRIIFSGTSASNTDVCASIATSLGISGYIAEPSAWIDGASETACGPSWTTVAGTCLRYTKDAA